MKKLKFIVSGGGTGGHIYPAIAIANAVKKLQPDAEILFVGAKGRMEMEKVPQAGYEIKGIDIIGFNRSSLIKNIGLPFKLIRSFVQVRSIINQFKPDAVIGVGGYSSFPVLRYAQSKGIATFIHESNSFAGKANMMLGRLAKKVFVASDGMEKFFPAQKIIITGNPVRAAIAHTKVTREEGLKFFGLDPDKKVSEIVASVNVKTVTAAVITQLIIQRSADSLTGFRSIVSMPDPTSSTNGFVDKKSGSKLFFYRIFYVMPGSRYVFSESKKPKVEIPPPVVQPEIKKPPITVPAPATGRAPPRPPRRPAPP